MIKITIETQTGIVSKVSNDGMLGKCFVSCCKALDLEKDKIAEMLEFTAKDLKETETKKK